MKRTTTVLGGIVLAAALTTGVGAAAQAEPPATGRSVELQLQAPDGRFLATTPEGGAALVAAAPDGELMRHWFLDPLPVAGQYELRNGSQTDGRDVCLQVPFAESVAVGLCDPVEGSQVLDLTHVGREVYTLHSDVGFVAVDAEGHLTTSTDPAAALTFQATYPLS